MIVGLAGHVDHGKTSLIRALTGVETDRLPEERVRGMTIDLGFAYAERPDGRVVGFVDVPGHERFLANMLAGVLAMERVLLVVAADDGAMPQTLEHLEVLRLVGVAALGVVVTKIDRVDAAGVAAVAGEMAALARRAGYDAAVFPVCSLTGEGVAAVWDWIDGAEVVAREGGDGFRLSIDRSFVLPGIGPVVTGTVAAGEVRAGDALVLSPARLAARVRSLRVQDRPAERAGVGDRCALAISGARIERARLRRGDWLVSPGLHAPTAAVDARVRLAEGGRLRHGGAVHVHLGAAALPARLRVWDEDGDGAFVRLQLPRAVPALHGDRLVLRDDGTGRVVAGGHVVDPFPPSRRRTRAQRLGELQALAAADPLAAILATAGWADLATLALARNRAAASLEVLRPELDAVLVGPAGRRIAVSAATRAAVRGRLLASLARYHAAHPDVAGPARAALLAAAGTEAGIAEAMLAELLAEGVVVGQGLVLRLAEHQPRLAIADLAAWPRVAALLAGGGLRPPRVREVAEALVLEPVEAEALLLRYERFGRVLRVAANRFFLPETVAALAREAAALAEADGFTAADFNRRTGIGRNMTIEVLEFLDTLGITRRTGELRHMVRDTSEVLGAEGSVLF
ncbi:MAG: selenocysteine-specific translation elongation factor [Acetobacteraceae bacterium]|nr:selenocysteine-specific translation elongation factor [Acetobacteraceae bacterium]